MNLNSATGELLVELGNQQVSTDPGELYRVSMDNLRYSRLPAARIFPDNEESVAKVIQLANKHRIAVTARGAGSATTGAATPVAGGWVLDFSGWKQLHIDPIARMAYAQPGVVLGDLDAAAGRHALTYPPDPGSKAYATVAGTIATNAGGMRGAKYGVTRDYVVALEGFLPTGEFVRWGGNLKKFSSGYNLRDLWIGSEGTLGIITGAILKLIPKPDAQATCLALFETDKAALECAQQILLDGQTPSAMEFLDAQTVECTFKFWETREPGLINSLPDCLRRRMGGQPVPSVLLVEVDGRSNEVKEQLAALVDCIGKSSRDLVSAIDKETVEILWKLRRSCSQAMFQLGNRKLNEDVVVPFESQLALMEFVAELKQETGLPTPTFGHAADGNFHVHIMYDDNDPRQTRKASEAIDKLMAKVVDLGGAISGEHGIGLAKAPFVGYQFSEPEIAAMRSIKKTLDPNNVLNPDKLWHPCEPWGFPRENVRMPWDH